MKPQTDIKRVVSFIQLIFQLTMDMNAVFVVYVSFLICIQQFCLFSDDKIKMIKGDYPKKFDLFTFYLLI